MNSDKLVIFQKDIENIKNFKMPRYNELPSIDLYIDQVLSYIDGIFAPLGIAAEEKPLTSSMVNNYVKKGVVPPTIKKRYSKEHIAYLVIVYIAKQIFTIDEIGHMIKIQKSVYDIETAYNYICNEMEIILSAIFTEQPLPQDTSRTLKPQRYFVRNTLISVAYKIHTQKLMQVYDVEETE